MSTPFCDLFLRGDPRTRIRQPTEARILQREYAHDTAVLTIPRDTYSKEQYADGRPVVLSWGWLPDDSETFVGYIHHTDQADARENRRELKVYCIGATYRFKDVHARTFHGMTAVQVAAQIAKGNQFALLADHDGFIHENLTQSGRSDWEFLVWLARRHGLVLYGQNTELRMIRRRIERTPGRKQPTFRFVRGINFVRGAAHKLEVKTGEQLPGTDKRNRLVGGVSNSGELIFARHSGAVGGGGGVHTTTSEASFSQRYRERPVRTPAEAADILEGEAELHRFTVQAHAELGGDTRVHQGSTIRLVDVDPDSDGFWYVKQADHRITRYEYQLHVELERDTLGDAAAGHTPLVSVSGRPALYQPSDVPMTEELLGAPDSVYSVVHGPSLERASSRVLSTDPTGWRASHTQARVRGGSL